MEIFHPEKSALLVVTGPEKRGQVNSRHPGQLPQQSRARPGPLFAPFHQSQDLRQGLFAVPQQNGIEKIGHRLGVEGAGAAADHQGMFRPTLRRPQRQAGQVEDGQNVAVAKLIGQADPQQIEIGQGAPRLQRE